MVYDGRYKLIRGFYPEAHSSELHEGSATAKPDPPILFDLKGDPGENVYMVAKASRHVDRLSRFLG